MAKNWHLYDVKTLEKKLKTDISEGLSGREAHTRLEKIKKREKGDISSLFSPQRQRGFRTILSFALTPSIILLLLISLLATFFGKTFTGGLVFAITLAGSVAGGIIKLNSKKRLEEMYRAASPMIRVRRGETLYHTDGKNLVPGDLIILSAGDILPCDTRLVYSEGLEVDELFYADGKLNKRRILKNHDIEYKSDDEIQILNAENCIYAGSAVIRGEAIAVVTEVGSNTSLSGFLPCGALAGKDSDAESVTGLKSLLFKTTFISMSALLILSILSLITMQKYEFISVFMVLLSASALTVAELVSVCAEDIFSKKIKQLSNKEKKRKSVVNVRNVKAFDMIGGISDLIFVGRAGLTDGINLVRSVYTANGIKSLDSDFLEKRTILLCIFTYIKALRESGNENDFLSDGYADSLFNQIKECGFDVNGASLAIKSLYFAPDGAMGHGFSCAETASETYRTTLVFDNNIIDLCRAMRDGEGIRNIFDNDREGIKAFEDECNKKGCRCMYVVSESTGTTVLECVAAVSDDVRTYHSQAMSEFRDLGVSTCVFLLDEGDNADRLINNEKLGSVFNGEIAYASDFKNNQRTVLDGIGEYCAYVGFSASDLSLLIVEMKKRGSKVAVYGIDNSTNDILAKADIAISCDELDYLSEKHRSAFYEKLPASGRDSNLRCSQQTRLLSKILVRRGNSEGGGIGSIVDTIKYSRAASVLLSCSVLFFALIMSTLMSFSVMSVFVGKMLVGPIQASAISIVFSILSLVVFSDQMCRSELITQKNNYALRPHSVLIKNIPQIVSRVATVAVFSVLIRIFDVIGLFGENSDFSLPISICITLTMFAEFYFVMKRYVKKCDGRRNAWLKVVFAYGILMLVVAVTTVYPMSTEIFPYGISYKTFFAVPLYVLIYTLSVSLTFLILKKRKK